MAISVKFKHGPRADYDRVLAAGQVDKDTLYFIEDTREIYHGQRNLARGNHYEGQRALVNDVPETDMQVIARVMADSDIPAIQDDIFIVKTLIADNKYSFTSYVHDGVQWCAMDGNYNAENVYFDEDLTFTKEIGYVTLENGSATLEAKGKNIKQVFQALFAKEEDGTVTPPSATITVDAFGAYEVGTTITEPAYTTTFDVGNYQYGPATGVNAITYTATFNGQTVNGDEGKFNTIQVTDNMSLKASLTVDHSAGATPLTNLGNESETENVAIAAGQVTAKSGTLSGYRKMFWGPMKTTELTSANIRALEGKKAGTGDLPLIETAEGDVCVIFAAPKSAKLKLQSAIMPKSFFYDAVDSYVKVQDVVKVEGAEGYTAAEYDVWKYEPDALSAGSQFELTIAKA